jgi:quercetin dioxygenase-like cupin family protein
MTAKVHGPELAILSWADCEIWDGRTRLTVPHGQRPVVMAGVVNGSGLPLVTNGDIGADVIRLPAGSGFAAHTHPGHHVLAVIGGVGTITYAGRIHRTEAGQIYLIEGAVPHAVGAVTDHVILAVGAPHKPVASAERMDLVPYHEVLAADGDLECTICGVAACLPARPHDLDCPHCPCSACVGMPG